MTSRVKDELLSAGELAEYLGKSLSWVYASRDHLPTLKLGKHLRFRLSEIDAWIERGRGVK